MISKSLCRFRSPNPLFWRGHNISLVASVQRGICRHFNTHRKPEEDPKFDKNKRAMGFVSGTLVAGSVLLGKTKYILAAMKLTKMAPLASMVITSATYSLFFGWPYAIGMVGLIFVHECGHAAAMRHYKVPFSPMVFVPFMGAVIAMKEYPADARKEAVIAIAGPIAGSAAALALGVGGHVMDSQLMLALADWGYMINLFNMLPSKIPEYSSHCETNSFILCAVGSLDGGRITSAVSPYFGIVGLAGGAGLIYMGAITNPIFYLIMMGGAYSTGQRVMGWDTRELPPGYYNMSRGSQLSIFASYLAVIAALLAAMKINNQMRKTPRQLEREATRGQSLYYENDRYELDDGNVYDDYFK
jgi:hypothetical protein